MQAIFKPWRASMVSTKTPAWISDWAVPVSSQAKPRLKRSTESCPRARYSLFTSVISNSPRAEGLRLRAEVDPGFGITWLNGRLYLYVLTLVAEDAARAVRSGIEPHHRLVPQGA